MAAINFPNSPSLNEIHTEGSLSWKWNGTAWVPLGKSGYVGDLLSTNNLSDVSSKSSSVTNLTTITDNSNTSITLSDSDSGKIINCTAASAVSIEIPSTLSSGFNVLVIQSGAGAVTFVAGSGATVNSYNSFLSISGQHGAASIVRTDSATYNLSGNLS